MLTDLKSDAKAPPLTRHYALGRAYIAILIGAITTVSLFGVPIPHLETVYTALSCVTIAALFITFLKPNNVMVRRTGVSFIIISMGARAAWWATFSRFSYHPHTHMHFSLGSSILEFFVYSAVAFGALMSVVQAEAIERMHE